MEKVADGYYWVRHIKDGYLVVLQVDEETLTFCGDDTPCNLSQVLEEFVFVCAITPPAK